MNYLLLILSIVLSYGAATKAVADDTVNRIAVAGGSITEIIYQLNEQHRIVGVDSTSRYPKEAQLLPLLGYVRNISAEGVLSLNPDLLIGEADTGPTKIVNQIKSAGINTVIIKEDNSIEAIKNKITFIATLLGVEDKGILAVQEMQSDLDALDYARKKITTSPRVLFLLSAANGSPIGAGNTTSAHTVILEAGGINVLAESKGWTKLSPESALALNPDVIVVMNNREDMLEQIKHLSHFKYTPAVKENAVYSIDGGYLLGFGPRTPQAIIELGTMIHPHFPLPADYTLRYQNSPSHTQQSIGH